MNNFKRLLFTCFLFFCSFGLSAQIEQLNLKPLIGSDDAEQNINSGAVGLSSSDLELGGYDGATEQIVGIRFPNVILPVGAIVTNAYIQFSADETGTEGASINIKAQQGNAATYSTINSDITSRPYTSSSVLWSPPTWSVLGERGEAQQTADLSGIIMEAMQGGFASGDALAFTFSVNQQQGKIIAESFEAGATTAAELVIQYLEAPIERTLLTDILVVNEVTGTGTLENKNDWVELYNTSNDAINLDSVFITDQFDDPSKFMFNQNNVNGQGFVFVETDDFFGIKDKGETIFIFQTFNGTTVFLDSLSGRSTINNTSYGRKPDGSTNILDFKASTPGASNNSAEEHLDLEFSQPRGLYTSGITLTLSSPQGGTIRYTTNSTRPSKTSGTVYSGPIQIDDNVVIKALAYTNTGTSKVVTSTYIINNNVRYQEIPVLSLSTTNSIASQIESDCTVEYIDKYGEGSSTFADAGFYVYGNASVGELKKNMRFKFRSQYGYSKFEHPIFEKRDVENYKPVKVFNSFDIKSGQDATFSYSLGGTNMSENIAHNYMREMGDYEVHTRHVHVFINGNYHGVYTLREQLSASYAEDYFGGDKDDYDVFSGTGVISSWEDFPSVSSGSNNTWNEIKSFATTNFQEIKARVEVDKLIDMMLLHFGGCFEWEYRAFVHREYERSKLRFHLNDFDGFIRETPTSISNYFEKLNVTSGEGPARLLYLAGFGGFNLEYNTMFKDRVLTLFDENSPEGVITVRNYTEKTNEFREGYRKYNQLEYDRWGYTNSAQFEQRVDGYLDYLPTRFQKVRTFLDDSGLMHTHDYVNFSEEEGTISMNTQVTINDPNSGTEVYYAIGGDDVVFDNAPSGTLYTPGTPLPLAEGINVVKSRAYSNGNFGPLKEITYFVAPDLNITGINYNPLVDDDLEEDDFEFLLITNYGSVPRTVADDTIKGISFVFPAGSVIEAGETVMVARSEEVYPSFTYRRILWADGKLSNKGEKLTWKNTNDQILNLLEYDDKDLWPEEPDGDGFYLKLIQDDSDNSIAANWEAVPLPPATYPSVNLSLFLEATYNDSISMMTNILENRGILPQGQPYNKSPWNYSGTETRDIDNVSDWVLVSFRTSTAKEDEIAQAAGLLMTDGCVHFPDINRTLATVNSPLYVVIEHRNHIAIMTPQPITISDNMLEYDFRVADSYIGEGLGLGQKELLPGVWGMPAGDMDQTDPGGYDISGVDKSIWGTQNGIFGAYLSGDINQDGDVNGADKILWINNNGIFSAVPK